MPTSELDWSSSCNRSPIIQMFGTKRKATEGVAITVHNCEEPQQQHPKRVCHWSENTQQPQQQLGELQPPPQLQRLPSCAEDTFCNNNNNNSMLIAPGMSPSFGNECNGMEVNHNNSAMEDQHVMHEQLHQPRQIVHPALTQVLSQQPPRVPSPWPSHQPFHQSQGQDSHIMDINGETYNTMATAAAEMESACSNMESDCTPDPSQYNRDSQQRSQNSNDFCKNYCGVGENSPTTGRVRCYCKPSWEGMLDMKPYVSDVY